MTKLHTQLLRLGLSFSLIMFGVGSSFAEEPLVDFDALVAEQEEAAEAEQSQDEETEEDVEDSASPVGIVPKPSPAAEQLPADAGADIVVTGSMRRTEVQDSPILTTLIDQETMIERGDRTVAEALADEPGIYIPTGHNNAMSGIQMQGLAPRYTLILVDGQPLVGRVSNTLDLNLLNIFDVGQIEVVRGPTSSLYGADAVAGVVNLVTDQAPRREGWSFRFLGQGGWPAHGDLSTQLSFKDGKNWVSLGLAGRYAHPFDFAGLALDRPEDYTDDQRFTLDWGALDNRADSVRFATGSASIRGHVQLSERWSFFGSAQYFGGLYIANEVLGRPATPSDFAFHTVDHRINALARLKYEYGDVNSFSVSLSGNSFWHDFAQEKLTGSKAPGTLGVDHRYTAEVIWQHLLHPTQFLTVVATGAMESVYAERIKGIQHRGFLSLGVQDEMIYFDERLIIIPGARVEYNTEFGFFVAPRLSSAFWAVEDKLMLRLGGGRGFRAPSFRDQYFDFTHPGDTFLVRGNRDLQPESSWGINGGFQWTPTEHLFFDVNGFANWVENQIVAFPNDDFTIYTYENVDNTFTSGFEVSGTIEWIKDPSPWSFQTRLGYSLTLGTTQTTDGFGESITSDLFGVPAHLGRIELRLAQEDFGLVGVIGLTATGPQRISFTEETFAPASFNLFARYEQRIWSADPSTEGGLADSETERESNLESVFDEEDRTAAIETAPPKPVMQHFNLFVGVENILNQRLLIPFAPGLRVYGGIRGEF